MKVGIPHREREDGTKGSAASRERGREEGTQGTKASREEHGVKFPTKIQRDTPVRRDESGDERFCQGEDRRAGDVTNEDRAGATGMKRTSAYVRKEERPKAKAIGKIRYGVPNHMCECTKKRRPSIHMKLRNGIWWPRVQENGAVMNTAKIQSGHVDKKVETKGRVVNVYTEPKEKMKKGYLARTW